MTNDTVAPGASGPPSAEPRRPRWLYGALVASMAVNLLVIGGAAGAFLKHRHGHHGERGLMGFVRELGPDSRNNVREFLKAERAKLKPIREEIKAGWGETNTLIGQEPFDKDKLKAAMTKMIEAEMKMRTAISDVVVETAAKLTPQERQRLQAWRAGMQERGHKKRRRHWEEDREGE